MDQASRAAANFRNTAQQVSNIRQDTGQQVRDTVERINQLADSLRDLNKDAMQGAQADAALDARMHSMLDELSGLVDVTAMRREDGSYTVLLGGQVQLVNGDKAYALTAGYGQPAAPPPVYADAPPRAMVWDSGGSDITSLLGGGKLGALLDMHNRVIPQLLGDAYQQGDLNRLAQTLADRVNELLTSGNATDGPPAQGGVALFAYEATPQAVALTLDLDSGANAGSLAAIDPGPPYSANGMAVQLAALGTPQRDADRIDGFSYSGFFGLISARTGSNLAAAREEAQYRAQMVTQAQSLREQVSGVSLDEEAAVLIQFQRSFQAVSKLFTVVDELTQEVVNLLK
jgi:flagellar hook-associated protein 1 FlgK